jgi:hypothetical protein
MKMDEQGNIMIKRLDKSPIYVKGWHPQVSDPFAGSVGEDVVEVRGKLEPDKAGKLFDMKRFQGNVGHELRGSYPDRRRLEAQCISIVAFGRDASELLELPCWLMVINVVALEMLKSRLPPMAQTGGKIPKFVSIFNANSRPSLDSNGGTASPSDDPYSSANHSLESKSDESIYFISGPKKREGTPETAPKR